MPQPAGAAPLPSCLQSPCLPWCCTPVLSPPAAHTWPFPIGRVPAARMLAAKIPLHRSALRALRAVGGMARVSAGRGWGGCPGPARSGGAGGLRVYPHAVHSTPAAPARLRGGEREPSSVSR